MMFWWVGLAWGISESAIPESNLMNRDSDTYQQTLLLHQHAQIPSGMSIRLRLVNDDGIEQALSTHCLDDRALDSHQPIPEQVAELLCTLHHVLLAHDLKRANSNGTAQWVSAVGRTMGTGLDREHDVLATQHARNWVHTTRDGLAEQDQVGLDSAPLVAQQLARAGDTSLDLVADQQHIVLVAECAGLLQVVWVGDNDACLTLDRLDEESSEIGTSRLEGLT